MIPLLELLDILSSRFLIVFVGEWGSGKTLSMVAYARLLSEYMGVKNITSNSPIYFNDDKNYEPLVETNQFIDLQPDTIICVDELLQLLDSRMALNPSNRFLTAFATSFRKLKVRVAGTVQYLNMVDCRFDELVQIVIYPSFVKKYDKNSKRDMQIRVAKKDFWMNWHIIDKKERKVYDIRINLYNYINMYDTNFIPEKLAVSHPDYYTWLQMSKSIKQRTAMEQFNEKLITLSRSQWNEGQQILMERG